MNDKKKYCYSKKISWQKIPGEESAFAYNISTHKYYEFNETEYYIWMYFASGPKSIKDITEYISNIFSISIGMIEGDIEIFINDLTDIGLIEEYERVRY